jgi:hypothetical protein
MTGKIVLNVVYNLAIFAFGACTAWGVKNSNYTVAISFGLAIILVLYFKIRLIKQVKEYAKTRKK